MRYDAGSCDVAVVGAGHAGIEAALAAARLGTGHRLLYHQYGRHRQHALQPRHRRHGQGPPRARARCARRRDGARSRSGLHPVPDAQPRQGPGRALAARAGRPAEVSGRDEAHARAAAEPARQAGGGRGRRDGGRPRQRRRDGKRRRVPLPRRRACDGHVSARAHDRGRCIARFRAGRVGGCRARLPSAARRWGCACAGSRPARRRA